MRRNAVKVICDLCREVEYEDTPDRAGGESPPPSRPALNWGNTTYKDLCEECLEEIDTAIKDRRPDDADT